MTGAYIRIFRNHSWENIEIDQLTNEELETFSLDQPEAGWKWAKFLAAWIRDHIGETDEF